MIELLVALGIFSLLALSVAWILITGLRQNAIIWDQLQGQTDGRRVLREVTDVVRRAETSSIGSYPVERADQYELIIYANIDTDTFRERVRFTLDQAEKRLKLGVTKPGGNPLAYDPANENVVVLARDVINAQQGQPVFTYFKESYTGTGPALTQPVTVTEPRVVRVQLVLERDPTKTPVPLQLESAVQMRNLKTN